MDKPIFMKDDDVAAALSISKEHANNLMQMEGFPAIIIGKRIFTVKDEFEKWANKYGIDTVLTTLSLGKHPKDSYRTQRHKNGLYPVVMLNKGRNTSIQE